MGHFPGKGAQKKAHIPGFTVLPFWACFLDGRMLVSLLCLCLLLLPSQALINQIEITKDSRPGFFINRFGYGQNGGVMTLQVQKLEVKDFAVPTDIFSLTKMGLMDLSF